MYKMTRYTKKDKKNIKKIYRSYNLSKIYFNRLISGDDERTILDDLFPIKKENTIKKSKDFYKTQAWKTIRYEVLKESNGRCSLCGRSAKDGVVLQVDHIIPLSVDWNLRLNKDNLQVLCDDCNMGKLNKDCRKWK